MSIEDNWRSFVVENKDHERSIFTYLQGLQEFISNFKSRTLTEKRRLTSAKSQLREIRKFARRMQNDIEVLQEKLVIIEEAKGNG